MSQSQSMRALGRLPDRLFCIATYGVLLEPTLAGRERPDLLLCVVRKRTRF